MSAIIQKVQEKVGSLFENGPVELVDLTYQKAPGGWALCFYIDKPEGITLTDCEEWSRKLGDVLEQEDFIPQAYSLEVSSPGLNRPLKKPADFERFKGERAKIRTFAPIEGRKNFVGLLAGSTASSVSIELEDEKRTVEISLEQVAKANLDPVIEI